MQNDKKKQLMQELSIQLHEQLRRTSRVAYALFGFVLLVEVISLVGETCAGPVLSGRPEASGQKVVTSAHSEASQH